MAVINYQTDTLTKPPVGYVLGSTGTASAYLGKATVSVTYLSKTFKRDIILRWQPLMATVLEGQMKPKPETPEDKIDRQIDAMTDDERMAIVMSMAGTWTHIEEPTEEEWGFYDWDASDDLSF
jgi:hypothetical protein